MLDIPKSMPKEFPFKLRDYVDVLGAIAYYDYEMHPELPEAEAVFAALAEMMEISEDKEEPCNTES